MFKFKDLYVTLPSETPKPGENVVYYEAPVAPPNTVESTICPPAPPPIGPVGTTACCEGGGGYSMVAMLFSEDAVQLKQYLAGQLKVQEMKKVPIQESGNLRTVDEIEALEQKLNGALGELKNRKAQLQKKAAATR